MLIPKNKVAWRLYFLAFPFSFLFSDLAIADDNATAISSNVINLEPITITALRSNLKVTRVAQNVSVLSEEDIQALPVRTTGEVLNYVPGVDVDPTAGSGQTTTLTMRGSNPRDVLIMVDDIPFNTQLSGVAVTNGISLESVKRIEVIKGASSSAWGSSLGGVVNVLTKDTGDTTVPKGSLTTSMGELATRRHSMDIAGKAGQVGYLFTDNYLTTKGAHFRSPVVEHQSFGKMAIPLGDQAKLTGSFGYSNSKVEESDDLDLLINRMPYTARYGKMKLDLDKGDYDLSLAYKYNDQKVGWDLYDAPTGENLFATASRDLYQGFGLNGHANVREEDVLTVGMDVDWHTLKSTNYLPASKDIRMIAPYANYTWRIDKLDIIPGVRFDENNRFGDQLSPSLGTVYRFNDAWNTQLRGRVSRAFNAPPLMWLFNEDPVFLIAPNPDLKAERALVYETGVSTNIGRMGAELNYYRSDVTDGIATRFNSDLGAFQKQNIGKIRRQGADAQLNYKVSEELKVYIASEYNHPVDRSARVLIRGNSVKLQDYRCGFMFKSANGLGVDVYGHYDRWDSNADPAEAANDRKILFDTKLSKDWKNVARHVNVQLFFNILNITNSKYWAEPSAPRIDRYFEGGATISF